jgi:hypothetical protein
LAWVFFGWKNVVFSKFLFIAYGREVIRGLVGVFVGYLAGIRRLECQRISWVFTKRPKFLYLFTKSTVPCRITSKRIVKASNHLSPFHLAPKHHRQWISFGKKRRSFLNDPTENFLFAQKIEA